MTRGVKFGNHVTLSQMAVDQFFDLRVAKIKVAMKQKKKRNVLTYLWFFSQSNLDFSLSDTFTFRTPLLEKSRPTLINKARMAPSKQLLSSCFFCFIHHFCYHSNHVCLFWSFVFSLFLILNLVALVCLKCRPHSNTTNSQLDGWL